MDICRAPPDVHCPWLRPLPACVSPAAAANQHFSQQAQLAAAGSAHGSAGRVNNPNHHHSAAAAGAAGRSGGGAGGAAGNSTRSKSRRTAPSVNSGSTGPPVGTKRGHDAGSDEAAPAAKKVGVCRWCVHARFAAWLALLLLRAWCQWPMLAASLCESAVSMGRSFPDRL